MHYDAFSTAVIEAEAIINRRPLTHISTDSRDTEAITPTHLLSPATVQLRMQPRVHSMPASDAEATRKSWKRAQNRVDAFWKAFKRDYLSLLHSRPKWRKTRENLKKDALVIMVDDTIERHEWKVGRIVSTIQSDDHVRQVAIKSGDGKIVHRDRTKLVKLELDE